MNLIILWYWFFFRLPARPKIPIIIIEPGTSLAPFRGFVQECQSTTREEEHLSFATATAAHHLSIAALSVYLIASTFTLVTCCWTIFICYLLTPTLLHSDIVSLALADPFFSAGAGQSWFRNRRRQGRVRRYRIRRSRRHRSQIRRSRRHRSQRLRSPRQRSRRERKLEITDLSNRLRRRVRKKRTSVNKRSPRQRIRRKQ